MVRTYKKKTDRLSWNDGQMYLAIKSALEEGNTYKSVAKEFGIPRSTIQRKIKAITDNTSSNEDNLKIGIFYGVIIITFGYFQLQLFIVFVFSFRV